MGVFEEDDAILVSTIIKLWVSEGFLKPVDGEILEIIGKEFLKGLVDRNLVLVDQLGSTGNIKRVKVHDLVRDLCVKQANEEGFYHVIGESSPRGMNSQRRIVIRRKTSEEKVFDDLQSMPHARSIICEHGKVPQCQNFGLLRTIHAYKFRNFKEEHYISSLVSGYVNLRHLVAKVDSMSPIFSSFNHLWNLKTLIILCSNESIVPTEIWKMPQIRHIVGIRKKLILVDPSSDAAVMENLVVLSGTLNFKFTDDVIMRIPNIKKLVIHYSGSKEMSHDDYYCLGNIQCMSKLVSLLISSESHFNGNASLDKLTYPQTLKSLTLESKSDFEWEMILGKIGSLPLLEKFTLWRGCFGTGKWEVLENQFPCLKYLRLVSCNNLRQWTAETSSIFPCLEKIRLENLKVLGNIPSEIGDMPLLQNIWIRHCSEAAMICAKEIVEEQMYLQGENLPFGIQVMVPLHKKEAMQSMVGPNFEVVYTG
ncbi:putative late blight resistance protein homolog R1B-16 [Salvia hispanica]|uniref:putative late blight resistance protein homolog R1B-16 n=1 Tax=Salvia hispanica TaxID=49212 RepID=UPI0020096E7A|nr:putative late blight resistance protein homolog R1B-16 [Salvia hispanica]